MKRDDFDNMLPVLEALREPSADEVGLRIAADFRRRRLEYNMSRAEVAEKSGVALANITRFERTGLISLRNLILLAQALKYTTEIQSIFSEPKFTTTADLDTIRRNAKRRIARKPRKSLK